MHALVCVVCFLGASAQLGLNEPRVESAHLYGNINKYAYYFTDLLIGSPNPQRTSVIVDTGSRLVGFPCRGCEHCGNHIDPAFNYSASHSARWLTCGVDCSSGCADGKTHCRYQETYSEGSTIAGLWFDDLVELDDVFHSNPPVRARMGCHMKENKLFYTQRANGIMGLAPSSGRADARAHDNKTRPTILQDLFRDKKHVSTEIFSICLATWGGRLTVGGYNSTYHTASVQWMPMNPSHYYFVYPENFFLDVEKGVLPNRGSEFGIAIIDSGTTYTYFPPPIFDSLVGELTRFCDANAGCAASRVGADCWRLNDIAAGPNLFPTIQIKFRGVRSVSWHATSYLHERGEQGVWCQTFMKNNLNQTVFGISWMLHKDVIFDLAEHRLGVVDAACPEHRVEPELLQRDDANPALLAVEDLATDRSGHVLIALGFVTLTAAVGIGLCASRMGRRRYRRGIQPEDSVSLM